LIAVPLDVSNPGEPEKYKRAYLELNNLTGFVEA